MQFKESWARPGGVFEPKLPIRGVLRPSGMGLFNTSAMHSQCLGAARGKHGFGANTVMDFRAKHLEASVPMVGNLRGTCSWNYSQESFYPPEKGRTIAQPAPHPLPMPQKPSWWASKSLDFLTSTPKSGEMQAKWVFFLKFIQLDCWYFLGLVCTPPLSFTGYWRREILWIPFTILIHLFFTITSATVWGIVQERQIRSKATS